MKKEPENLGKFLVEGSISFSISGLIQQLLLMAQGIITYYLLTVSERGLYATVWSIFAFAGTFTFVNMVQQIVIKKVSTNVNDKKEINQVLTGFIVYSIISSSIFVLFFILTFLLERLDIIQIFDTGLSFPLLFASVSIFSAVSGYSIVFIGIKEYSNYNLIQIISSIIHFVSCIGPLLYFNYFTSIPPYYGIFIGLFVKTIIVQFMTTKMVHKKYGRFRVKLKELKGFRNLFIESFGLGVDFILYSVLIEGSIIVLSIFAPEEIVANYEAIRNAGLNISRIIGLLLGSMLLSLIPNYLKKFEYELVEKMTGYVSKLVLYFLSIIMLAMVIIPEAYIQIFNSDKYLGIQGLFFVCCFQILYNVLSVAVRPILISQKKIHTLIYIHAIRTIIFLVLSIILLPMVENKLNGILIIVSISYTLNIISTIYLTQNASKVHFFKYYKRFFIITVLFLIIFSLVMVPLHIRLTFLWKIPIFLGVVILFHIVIVAFGAIAKQDVEIIEKIIRSFFITRKNAEKKKWVQFFVFLIDWIFKILKLIPFKDSQITMDNDVLIKENVCIITQSKKMNKYIQDLVESGYSVTVITSQNSYGIIHQKSDEYLEYFFTTSRNFLKESVKIFNTINNYKHFTHVISIDFAGIGIVKYARFKSSFIIIIENYWRNHMKNQLQSSKLRDKFRGFCVFFHAIIQWVTVYDTLTRAQKIVVRTESIRDFVKRDLRSEENLLLLVEDFNVVKIL